MGGGRKRTKNSKWTKNSLLHFDEDKCVHKIISNKRSNREIRSYELNDKQLKTVGEERDLGMIIGSKLSFDSHNFAKVKNANSNIAAFKKTLIK